MIRHDTAIGRTIVIGFRRWRVMNLSPLLQAARLPAQAGHVVFVRSVAAARALRPGATDQLIVWGATDPPGLANLVQTSAATLVRIEDGFIRSVGLGSDLIAPRSVVFDRVGIYFDATRPSALETLLATLPVDAALRQRAAALRTMIVARGLTKYNIESPAPPHWHTHGRPVVLVPGQVETDASIRLGTAELRTNLALLAAARAARPDAYVVYKPHPDVATGNRCGRLAKFAARQFADHVETRASIIACLAQTDEVHTLTSLAGFDALMRGIAVVTYGMPFYAGWGLTDDRCGDHPGARLARGRRGGARRDPLTINDLVAGALLHYPMYWHPPTGTAVPPECAIAAIASERDQLRAGPAPARLVRGFWRRQARKASVLARAWLMRGRQHLPD